MQLIEQEKLHLEDKLYQYLPTYKENDITIYHLLTMTSGFGYDVDESPSFQKLMKETNGEAGTVEVMSCFANDLFYFSPGERWRYSKSHDVLGAVIEVVSGMRLGVYLKKHIMEPLGMRYTTFDFQDPYVQEHVSALYEYDGKNEKAIPIENKGSAFGKNVECGGQGLYSCTDDYILLVDALANGGVGKTGSQILSESSIDKIKEPQLDFVKQSQFIISHYKVGYSYGLGVRTLVDKGYGAKTPIGEFGWDGMTGGYSLVDTKNHIAICYMQNVMGCDYAWHKVFPDTRDMIYDILGIRG